MKKKMLAVILVLAAFTLSGCIYANIITPLDKDVEETTLGSKTGSSSCQSVLWLVAWGDAGSAAAAKNGSISVIKHMDQQNISILYGLYAKQTTIVYGD